MGSSSPSPSPSPVNLVYFSCVAKAAVILAEHRASQGDAEVEELAAKCLECIPPLHSRFTHTIRKKMFNFLMEGHFVYFAIVDEALGKPQAFLFLEHVRDEFKKLLKSKGGSEGLGACCFRDEFGPVYKRLVAPLVGIPQIEKDRMTEEEMAVAVDKSGGIVQQHRHSHAHGQVLNSPTASLALYDAAHNGECNNKPLLGGNEKKKKTSSSNNNNNNNNNKKKGNKDKVTEIRDIVMESKGLDNKGGPRIEVVVDGSMPGGGLAAMGLQKSASFRSKGQQIAQRMWWRNVRLVLVIDVTVCAILFGVWLGICHGFQCISDS